MSQSAIQSAIQQICQEKSLSEEVVLRAIEAALAAAYRKDFGNKMQNIITEFDPKTGDVKVFDVKTVVEDLPEEEAEQAELEKERVLAEEKERKSQAIDDMQPRAFVAEEEDLLAKKFNPKTEIQLKDAALIDKEYKISDEIVTPLEVPGEFGRMAAQTAKQVIIQKIREEERQRIFEEYKGVEHELINGTIQRREGRNVLVDIGHTTAIMLPDEQVERERYNIGNRMKFYLKSVEQTSRGPQIVVSRADAELVRKIFEAEIPEILNGAIEIKDLAREAGSRSKVAIATNDENIDPIGSCVGQRGTRIQTIIGELNNEKVDIILWDEDPVKFIGNALSPAKILSVKLDEENKIALVNVLEDQLSLAIGKGGQNVRLASRLSGWKIDIISDGGNKVSVEDGEVSIKTDEESTEEEASEVEANETKTEEQE
ncbi:MAG: transcription termination factor NusA [Patescibacteria group bacterium]